MKLAFVLVEPKVPENVGAAARALCTMGFSELWLVNSDLHTRPEAHWLAHGSDHILDNARIFPDLAAVRNSADLLMGTSAKPRHNRQDWHEPAALRTVLSNKGDTAATAALVFGREDRGLANEELALCDLLTGFPMAVTYPSLNLAQAVMLYAWELSGLQKASAQPETAASTSGLAALRSRLESLLPELDAPADEKLSQWVFEKLPLLSDRDIGFVHTLCGNIERKL
ncbi:MULTISPECIES: tRNA/rRNA methyltransferase [Marinobacter]|jgi:tRNA/rRNA methyltransferase|uniref:tRNA (cytidine/uridine-2'-O-)-methyltransferase TrmJ n=1 Tax=Marinobacter alkaliphilus TaxID=254719 RepID=A0ABZ3E3N6_9GAMM|nr:MULTISPECIES: tRNA/rRNA methyltransferase [Marinobacter]MCD1628622.1 tRNA/rRNA methyltransferase [Marinobacter shengliensis]MDX5388635.1 tRNA/rRNA methyltransferase [Marinobacter sp.]MDX5440978.1 tRNA/rRNA methyltransferase [Alteromonadaceae bacterium]MDX5473838.1 tRNA/rRNA methyltransferase [Marinobacter sp.]